MGAMKRSSTRCLLAIVIPALARGFGCFREGGERSGATHIERTTGAQDARDDLAPVHIWHSRYAQGLVSMLGDRLCMRLTIDPEGLRILVVDDEEYITDLVAVGLRFVGFDVKTASDGRDALAKIATDSPDLV